jgi:hypothetical protein
MESSTEPPWPDSLPAGPSEFRRKVESRSLAGSAGDTNLTMRHCRQLRAQGQPMPLPPYLRLSTRPSGAPKWPVGRFRRGNLGLIGWPFADGCCG